MHIDLHGKRALVTGSTSGMGYAIAKGLAEAGAAVVVHGRSNERVAATRKRLLEEHPDADVSAVAADLADEAAVDRLIGAMPMVDILVNNAGPIPSSPFFAITAEEWRRYFDVYVTAAARLAQHHLRQMIDRRWGRMLFSAGVTAGFSPGPEAAHVLTAWITCKAALLGMSRGLAEIAANSGVTVNAFIPGPTHTEESYMSRAHPEPGKTYAQLEREYFDGLGASSILGRFLAPREVANVVVFLASDQASAITGAALYVDGGIIRSIV